ncbi:hypothetical protein F5146DRAFT_623312 [Armillaria mellea]|nr:hypothetical protein F5146DRAFT_623312 [Armillaria mellea]
MHQLRPCCVVPLSPLQPIPYGKDWMASLILQDIGGHHIIQALAALYERDTTSSDLRGYIKEYIGVQYNAVIEKATPGGSNIYGLPWTGPPGTSFSRFNQTVAVTALLSAIQLVDDERSSKSSDNPTSSRIPTATASPFSSKKNPTGAIIGGVVGGFVVLVVSIFSRYIRRTPYKSDEKCYIPR